MKKTVLHAALIALTMPMSLYGLGLGEMKIKSALDQPFLAEIDLIDVGSAPLTGIRVGVADPENFEQIGMDRAAVLSLLHFTIEKNEQGRFVVKVQSVERMTDPYMELVVDLTWPHGQLYKAYTILLDPPGYQLISTTAQSSPTHYKSKAGFQNVPGVIHKQVITQVNHNPVNLNDAKKKTSYGPTVANENVWQIAQRYKSSGVTLPQVVLAIVGSNPDAFINGNLNGLKVGVRLNIPSTDDMMDVAADLAMAEVMAHDSAWNDKASINHVMPPPYINVQGSEVNQSLNNSEIPAIPRLNSQGIPQQTMMQKLISLNSSLPIINANQPVAQPAKPQSIENNETTKAELSITTAAVESVRESNALLKEQLHLLQDQNKALQQKLDQRDQQMQLIQKQMTVMMKERLALAGQANVINGDHQGSYFWPLLLLFLAGLGGGGGAYWYFRIREDKKKPSPFLTSVDVAPHFSMPDAGESVLQKPEYTSASVISDDDPKADCDEVKEKQTPEPITEQAVIKKKPGRKKKKAEEHHDVIVPESAVSEMQEETPIKSEVIDKPVVDMGSESTLNQDEAVGEPEIHQTDEHHDSLDCPAPPSEERVLDSSDNKEDEAHHIEDTPIPKEPVHQEALEFESGLHQSMTKEQDQSSTQSAPEESSDSDNSLDFYVPVTEEVSEKKIEVIEDDKVNALDVNESLSEFFAEPKNESESKSSSPEAEEQTKSESQNSSLLKSTKALDTLLDLAKTYIGMEDYESARHSLDEVMEFGSEEQKEKANKLLLEIKGY